MELNPLQTNLTILKRYIQVKIRVALVRLDWLNDYEKAELATLEDIDEQILSLERKGRLKPKMVTH